MEASRWSDARAKDSMLGMRAGAGQGDCMTRVIRPLERSERGVLLRGIQSKTTSRGHELSGAKSTSGTSARATKRVPRRTSWSGVNECNEFITMTTS